LIGGPVSSGKFPALEEGIAHGHPDSLSDHRFFRAVLALRARLQGDREMNGLYALGLLVTAALTLYLFYALLKPERF
jgi:K+-transporting ATPase KdpF subunit